MPRLSILTEQEQIEFDYPPALTTESRAIAFAIDEVLAIQIKKLRGATNKVGFFLQYAYFKASRRFFLIKRFYQEDIEYAAKLLNLSLHNIKLTQYKNTTPNKHKVKILEIFSCKSYQAEKSWIEKEVIIKVQQVLEPRSLFFEMLHQLHNHQVEIPAYHTLSALISEYYLSQEKTSLTLVENNLNGEQKQILKSLLSRTKSKYNTRLTNYKVINQSLKPKSIYSSVKTFQQISELAQPLMPLIDSLKLTPQTCEYYATWVKKSKLSQLKQFSDERKIYFHLIAFLQHHYYARQDSFVDIFLRSVQSSKNSALHQLKKVDQSSRSDRQNAIRHLAKTHRSYRSLIDEITEATNSTVLTDKGKVKKISELLALHESEQNEKEQKKLDLFEKSLDDMAKDKDYFDILERLSRKLQARVSEILKVLTFNKNNSDKALLNAINHFKEKGGQVAANAPQDFLDSDERAALITDKGTFRTSLYKILLFIHVADNIKSGKLNLKHSYRYLAIQEYLIEKSVWESERSELLQLTGLKAFKDCNTVMEDLSKRLDNKYHAVNNRILNNLNPHISFNDDKDNYVHVVTPALDEKETKQISAFLNQAGYIPILRVLSDIDHVTNFTNTFAHHSIKHSKSKPKSETFYASIIGLGCNIGVVKMAQISAGIKQNTMLNAVNWFFSVKTLTAANDRIREFINRLALPHIFAEVKDQRHGSSDGRKVGVSVECLLATYSFKYFGKDKGISVYTFIDDRQILFHHNVMSSSEREAAYVIDGLNNINVPKIDIQSTDTHGYTELVFGTTHFFGTTFAPRIKSIGKQKIYAFTSKNTYKKLGYKILPCRPIRQSLIAKHWEDILRFMVTIKLNKVSASQLFKRLSSYAKDNPLYKALKEFGRIIKSLFILSYFDDVKLRQRIEKQLNRIESSNKFAKAIFYANNSEFKQADQTEQNIAVACKVLIQNSIVLWNYLYLSQLLTNCSDEKERSEMISLIKQGSVLAWAHVNLHGEFDFKRKAANESLFNIAKILSLKIA